VTVRTAWAAMVAATLLMVVARPAPAGAQQTAEPPRFTAEASAVVLDVVVRGRDGRPVTGLLREDFEVFEARARQTITVFEGPGLRAVDPAAPRESGARRASTPDAASPARVVALVFEQLGPGSRILAAQAARRLIDALGPGDFAGVFTVDRAVQTLAGYAPASDGVRSAVDAAASRPGMPLRRAGVVPGAEFGDAERGAPTQETRDEAKRTRGMSTLDALSQIIKGLALLPGRKMVVLFSEGLALDKPENQTQGGWQPLDVDDWLTDGRFERFQRLLEEANAAQVAFYTFDAAGLRVDSPFASLGFGRAPYVGLLALAEGTGGAFVENTNDLAPGAVRAAEDQASYYVLGYTPAKAPDGEYRSLDVRVRCEGCRVLARRGYRATPNARLRQVGVRDVAPFLLLDGGPAAKDLPMTLEVGKSAPADAKPSVAILASMPESAATAGGLVTFLARLIDGKGRATAVVSQHFELRGPSGAGAVLRFERTLARPSARCDVEVVVYDHASARASVIRRRAP
jgi:VWFA-related protein